MKVLWVTTFPPRRCGIGDYAADLAANLLKIRELDLRILTYADGMASGLTKENGLEVLRTLGGGFPARRVAGEIRTSKPDLVHLQSSSFLHPPAINRGVAEACQVPLVTTVHDTPGSWRVFYMIQGLRKVYRKSSRLLVHSAGVARTLSTFHAVDGRRIMQIALGVDITKYSPHAPQGEALHSYALEGRRVILFFGFVRPGKGLETLLIAWSKIESSLPDAVLVVAGGVPSEPKRYDYLLKTEADYPKTIRALATQIGISKRVVFTGYVPESLVPGLLASAEVIVLPYEGGISQSGPLNKALASGCAIVATDVPGIREIIRDGSEGRLIPPRSPEVLGEAIKALLEDPAKARELRRQARAKAETSLAWSAVAARTLEVYESLSLTESPPAGGAVQHPMVRT